MRIQIFPSDKLKIEPWLVNGWQSFGMFNHSPGGGVQCSGSGRLPAQYFLGFMAYLVLEAMARGQITPVEWQLVLVSYPSRPPRCS